jgi:hypothetical protein
MATLQEMYQIEKKQESVLLPLRRPDNESGLLNSFWSMNRTYGAYEMTQGNIAAAKYHFYQCARTDMMRVRKFNARIFDYGLNNVCIMLLSDCFPLAKDYARLRYQKGRNAELSMDEMVQQGESPIWVHSLFMIIEEDWEQLAANITSINKRKLHASMEYDLAFLQAMYDKDQSAVEKLLQEMATPTVHRSRIDPPDPAGEVIFFAAAGYAKLAWMKGMKINVNSPVVPGTLLPLAPLPEYRDRYDFVNDYLGS